MDVAGVAVELAAGVNQAQLALLQLGSTGGVVQHAGIGAGRHDGAVGGALRAVAAKLVQQLGLNLVLGHPAGGGGRKTRGAKLHGARMGAGRNGRGAAHGGDLLRAFDEPHFIEQLRQIAVGAGAAGALVRAPAHGGQPAAHGRAEHGPHGALVVDEFGQLGVELVNRVRLIHTQGGGCGLRAQAVAIPHLAFDVFAAAKQHRVAVGTQGKAALRLIEAGEVVKVAVVAEREIAVAVTRHLGCRHHQRQAPTGLVQAGFGVSASGLARGLGGRGEAGVLGTLAQALELAQHFAVN